MKHKYFYYLLATKEHGHGSDQIKRKPETVLVIHSGANHLHVTPPTFSTPQPFQEKLQS